MSDSVLNVAIEDALAMAVTEEDRHLTLCAGLLLLTEYLARETGRKEARDALHRMDAFVRDAKPFVPWPD